MKRQVLGAALALACCAAVVSGAGAAGRQAPPLDTHWLRAAAQGDVFEVTMGKLGLQKGSGTTCTVARMLVTDHTKALRQTQRVATRAGVPLPARPNPLQDSLIQVLSSTSGTSFQQLFSMIGLGSHRLAVSEALEVQRRGQVAAVRALAQQELPVLRRHLAQFQTLAKEASAAATAAGAAATTTAPTTSTRATTTQPTQSTTAPAAGTTTTTTQTGAQTATGCGTSGSGG